MADMTKDVFAEHPSGKAALALLGDVPNGFRLFYCEVVGPPGSGVLLFRGAQFRVAKRGRYKGLLSVMVKDTVREVVVTRADILEHEGA